MPCLSHSSRSLLRSLLPLAAAAFLGACSQAGLSPQPTEPPPPEVTVQTLQPESVLLTRELPGRTRAYQVAEVRPQVSGLVRSRLFAEGGMVTAGEPLYQLDDAAYRAEVDRAQAALVKAQASLKAARVTAARFAELVKANAVSRQEHDNAQAALAQAEADVGVARAALESARVQLGHARIAAPIGGRIGRSTVTQGALVTANQATPLATVQQLDPIYVDVTQSSSELLQLRRALAAGAVSPADDVPVQIVLEDGTPYSRQGRLAFSEVTVDPGTGSFALSVVVDNPEHVLLPGMYVRAVLGAAERADALLVSQQAVVRDPKGAASVLVVDPDGKVEARPVRVSRTIGDSWLVEEGLARGERVIVEGLQKVRPGMVVSVAEPARAPIAAAGGTEPSRRIR
ncbi:MAG: efflux RND transporter periplasmic adaptor subunit [Burkholderiaceae bacterium]|nr:efflux RND transporter periplasmic adaptor subunit [Burkholderiaceae bacterium]